MEIKLFGSLCHEKMASKNISPLALLYLPGIFLSYMDIPVTGIYPAAAFLFYLLVISPI